MRGSISRRQLLAAGAAGLGSLAWGEVTPAEAAGSAGKRTSSLQDSDWPILAPDAGRSGATAAEVRPPFVRKWYRLFTDEGLMSGVQPIAADGHLYVGTQAGVLHALDAG